MAMAKMFCLSFWDLFLFFFLSGGVIRNKRLSKQQGVPRILVKWALRKLRMHLDETGNKRNI